MAKDSSFDVVSDYDPGEMTNAVDQAQRELATRYDFKGTSAKIEFMADKVGVQIEGDSKNQLDSIVDMLQTKLLRRDISIKVLDLSSEPVQGGMTMRWAIKFKKGLDQEKAKKITKLIREAYPKAKAQVQGESVRVSSSSRDELQGIIVHLKAQDLDFPLDFNNYR
ncbi:MAG TPA: YajQ family cyclic di-GMP-binding protein [Candidatus Saccharimonadales bacterium]|nr:YajQ family cyclic di-GMP-binding protein [Candidatus Saccharimonadales bacterium]